MNRNLLAFETHHGVTLAPNNLTPQSIVGMDPKLKLGRKMLSWTCNDYQIHGVIMFGYALHHGFSERLKTHLVLFFYLLDD